MGEAAARDVAFRNKEIDVSILGPTQYVAYKADPNLAKDILEVAEVFTRNMRLQPRLQALPGQAGAPGDQLRHRRDLIIKRLAKDKAYRAVGLAAGLLAGLRQGREALRLSIPKRPRRCWPRPAIRTASSSS